MPWIVIFVCLISVVINLFILYLIVKSAIDNSKVVNELSEIRRCLNEIIKQKNHNFNQKSEPIKNTLDSSLKAKDVIKILPKESRDNAFKEFYSEHQGSITIDLTTYQKNILKEMERQNERFTLTDDEKKKLNLSEYKDFDEGKIISLPVGNLVQIGKNFLFNFGLEDKGIYIIKRAIQKAPFSTFANDATKIIVVYNEYLKNNI